MRKIFTAISIMLACLTPALAQESSRQQDSIRAVREQKLRLDNYRQSPENVQKIKALLEKEAERKSKKQDSLNVTELDFLRELDGKYPYEVKLFENAALSKRLKKLLGGRFNFLTKNFDVQTPIEIVDGIFTAFACQVHNCGVTDFMIAYDFSADALFVGVREEKQVKIYSENGDIPAQITKWAN